ncbi:MAG: hypothetical protein CMO01_03020 [Thalassobius sp.]|nr:hypothetical protein [Thalassovita sp.]
MKLQLLLASLLIGHFTFAQKAYQYPTAPKDATTDTYFNESIEDPYQWMENPTDPRLEEWLSAQKSITKKQSSKNTRIRELQLQLSSMYHDVRRESTKQFEKEETLAKYEFEDSETDINKLPDLLYKLSAKGNFKLLAKANWFKKDKNDHVIFYSKHINEKEDLALVNVSINGSDWLTGYVFDLKTGEMLPDTIKYIRKSTDFAWHGKTIYYDAFNPPAKGRELLDVATGQKLYKYTINSSTEAEIVYQNPDQSGRNSFDFDQFQNKLFLYHFIKTKTQLYNAISVADLESDSFFPKNFLTYPNEKGVHLNVDHVSNDSVFIKTTWNAPNGKVLLANINEPNKLSELIPEYDIPLQYINKLGKNIAAVYLQDGQNIALIFNRKGELLKKIDFPKGKKLNYFYELNEDAKQTSFSITSFYHPELVYQISLEDLNFWPVETLSVPYNPDDLETRLINYKSKDGTEIPMYITCLKETKLNGKNPVLIHGYGGYGITVEPDFDYQNGLFLLHGGILAVPNVRGGGANGSEWALAGRGLNKQNTIDDFVAAAEYLINEKYTNPEKICITGGSHGGMLIGAAITQRPELFKAAIAEAGALDMLRLNKYTAGFVSTNINEFGDINKQDEYLNLKSYSPLHQIKKGVKYPNLLLITGDSDDRVPPHHSYKFLATLQELGDPTGLAHVYVLPGAGHGGALTQEDWENHILYKYFFILDQLGIDYY